MVSLFLNILYHYALNFMKGNTLGDQEKILKEFKLDLLEKSKSWIRYITVWILSKI